MAVPTAASPGCDRGDKDWQVMRTSTMASHWQVEPCGGGYACIGNGLRLNPWPFSQKRALALAALCSDVDPNVPPTGAELDSLVAFLRAFCSWNDTTKATRTETASSALTAFRAWAAARYCAMRDTPAGQHHTTYEHCYQPGDGYRVVPWPAFFAS